MNDALCKMRFRGAAPVQLDEKNRITIPADMQVALGNHFWFVVDEMSNLAVYPHDTWTDIVAHLANAYDEHGHDPEVTDNIHDISATAEEIKTQNSGATRVTVSYALRTRTGLGEQVPAIARGEWDHIVIWTMDRYKKHCERLHGSESLTTKRGRLLRRKPAVTKADSDRQTEARHAEASPASLSGGDVTPPQQAGAQG